VSPRQGEQDTGLDHMRFVLEGAAPERGALLALRRVDALDLLEWLGVDRPEFGRIPARELAALCRRRLWPIARNVDAAFGARPAGALQAYTQELLAGLAGSEGSVLFG
jgi:hypothetical protein